MNVWSSRTNTFMLNKPEIVSHNAMQLTYLSVSVFVVSDLSAKIEDAYLFYMVFFATFSY